MTSLHLTEPKFNHVTVIVRRRSSDKVRAAAANDAPATPPRGANIFSLARVICKRATEETPLRNIAA